MESIVDQKRVSNYWSERSDEFIGLRMQVYSGIIRQNCREILRR